MKELLSIEDPIAGLLGAWSAGLNLGSALLRIALIVALAASIGCERSSKRHSAGLRTFVLAAFSATVSMLLDQYSSIADDRFVWGYRLGVRTILDAMSARADGHNG